ncbi:glycoside hydrolase family protein [Klebsiella pneumoniae]|uniref:glycoside hydrolase family protein n=1 Tax=Klebsiella pneumoniae TaxID=573 RepID=UPI003D801900
MTLRCLLNPWRFKVYKDTEGYWTVGIGHLLTKNPTKEQAIACLDKELNRVTSGVISKPESEQLFNQDTSRALQDISRSELKWFTEFGHLNRGDMLTSEQHRCHNEKKKFQRRV